MKYLFLILFVVGCVSQPETGKTILLLTQESDENALGKQAFEATLQKEQISKNAKAKEILQRVAGRLAQTANKPDYEWDFRLVDSPEKNAFCLPGGKVVVYTGMLALMQNEAGMAVVIGHEIAHATLRHAGQRITRTMGTNLGLSILSSLLGDNGNPQQKKILMAALGLGTQVGLTLPFSRDNEKEADTVGLKLMAKAGYDPSEAPRFWDRFETAGGKTPEFLSTHPASTKRKYNLESQLEHVQIFYQQSPKYGLGEKL